MQAVKELEESIEEEDYEDDLEEEDESVAKSSKKDEKEDDYENDEFDDEDEEIEASDDNIGILCGIFMRRRIIFSFLFFLFVICSEKQKCSIQFE